MEDVTILIQGRINPEFIKMWINEYESWNVILSTWNYENVDGLEFPKNWIVLLMPKPERYGDVGNLDLQLTSTLNGLYYVKTKYVIKVRGDEFFYNLYRFVREIKLKSEQIIFGDIFYRALEKDTHYHISDHIIGGSLDNVKDMFENTQILLSNNFKFPRNFPITHIPEPYLGFGFIQFKEKIPISNIEIYLDDKISMPLCEKWYDTFAIEKFGSFFVRRGVETHSSRCKCDKNF
jgi:hypothetical protein